MSSKNRKLLILVIVAVLLAVLAGYATYHYLSPKKTTIYQFNSNYSAGATVTTNMLTPVVVDSGIMTGGRTEDTSGKFVTVDNISSVLLTNNVLRMDVAAGMPLTYSMLSVTGGSSVETYMDPTKIAVTIPVNAITGVTNDLKDGSRVNVYVTGTEIEGITLLLQSMRILSANQNEGQLYSVTIECDQDEALKLVYAANYTKLYLGLVDASGYQYVSNEPAYIPALDAMSMMPGTVPVETGAEPAETDTEPAEPYTEPSETEAEPNPQTQAETEAEPQPETQEELQS